MSDEVEYTLTATVNGELVYHGTFLSTVSLEEDLYKAEHAVEEALEYA